MQLVICVTAAGPGQVFPGAQIRARGGEQRESHVSLLKFTATTKERVFMARDGDRGRPG